MLARVNFLIFESGRRLDSYCFGQSRVYVGPMNLKLAVGQHVCAMMKLNQGPTQHKIVTLSVQSLV